MTLPSSMRYVDIREPGPPDVLHIAQGPVPQPKAGEVLVEVAYAGVNRPDCLQRAGAYPPPADASPVPGLEVAGRIAALGEGDTSLQVGDEVCALTPGGGYAEYCTTPAGFCLPGRLLSRRFLGEVELVQVAVQGLDHPLQARVRGPVLVNAGEDVGVEIDPDEVLVFAAGHP